MVLDFSSRIKMGKQLIVEQIVWHFIRKGIVSKEFRSIHVSHRFIHYIVRCSWIRSRHDRLVWHF